MVPMLKLNDKTTLNAASVFDLPNVNNVQLKTCKVILHDVVALLPGTGNTSTNTLAFSQRSNLLSQRSTSLAQQIKAVFISSPLPVP